MGVGNALYSLKRIKAHVYIRIQLSGKTYSIAGRGSVEESIARTHIG